MDAPTDDNVKAKEAYQNFTIGTDNQLVFDDDNKNYYARNLDNLYSSTGYLPSGKENDKNYVVPMYVEDRFADGDFRYAGGTIPIEEDERFHRWTYTDLETGMEKEGSGFFPIWPDDYLFFGQLLTYGYSATETHQDVPTAIARSDGRLAQTTKANRVYRAPAYFRNKNMGVAHFNPNAYLAQYKKNDPSTEAYPRMTAIDFAGHYDTHVEGGSPKDYELGLNETTGKFYAPLLDDDGLLSIRNCDETKNLLVYAPGETDGGAISHYANKQTYDVLNDYFTEPEYANYYDGDAACTEYTDGEKYDRVADATSLTVYGHLVQTNKNATNDHMLVDKQDFNCPIEYQFDGDYRMWYQRKSDDQEFVDKETGWQGISLPFSAKLVTTNDKGEITHFFSGSETSKNGTEKIGHEYWLRDYQGILSYDAVNKVVTAKLSYPSVLESDYTTPVGRTKAEIMSVTMNKTGSDAVTNTFLWDYYYQGLSHGHQDKNLDTYQTYYKTSRSYTDYSLLTNGIPYILGLPGETYYEFDLSGKFEAKTTATTNPVKLGKQVVSFVSKKGETIKVSDDELVDVTQTYSGTDYTFKPSYLNESLAAGTDTYTLKPQYDSDSDGKADCSSYVKVPASGAATTVSAFRPYFTSASSSPTKEYQGETRAIVFSKNTAKMFHEEGDDISNTGELIIKGRNGRIIVTSTMRAEKNVTIVTAAGALIDRYTIQPGQTRETPVNASGVYIVNKKKLSMKIK